MNKMIPASYWVPGYTFWPNYGNILPICVIFVKLL